MRLDQAKGNPTAAQQEAWNDYEDARRAKRAHAIEAEMDRFMGEDFRLVLEDMEFTRLAETYILNLISDPAAGYTATCLRKLAREVAERLATERVDRMMAQPRLELDE
jgi:tRNA 2-selenouridine synthase SelU